MAFEEKELKYSELLFDPNNYRFQNSPDFVTADSSRFHEESVQQRAYLHLKQDDSLAQLKKSFITNGFIPIERIVVRPYTAADGLYVVLEGNRRLAALKWISEDNEAGVSIPTRVLEVLEKIPTIVVGDDEEPSFYESLMGVRHVSGIKQWGGYQRSKLVATLRDEYDLSSSEVADRLGMSAQEVNRRYRAFKALKQMQDNETFGAYAKSDKYPIFHEAVSLPIVREWLGWDETSSQFTEDEKLDNFYELVTPVVDEESQETREPKITTYLQVRELREILSNTEARRILLDPNRSFMDALSIAKREELSGSWVSQVAEAIGALSAISVLDLQEITPEDLEQIEKIRDVAAGLIKTYEKIKT